MFAEQAASGFWPAAKGNESDLSIAGLRDGFNSHVLRRIGTRASDRDTVLRVLARRTQQLIKRPVVRPGIDR